AGALVAAEMKHVGLPWDERVHDAQLTAILGPRPLPGGRPAKLEALAGRIRTELGAPSLNPDSAPELLKALHSKGIEADTTRQWELERIQHPVIEPLLEYKKLSRLLSANGWAWMAAWVHGGRFRPDYVPGGVVTGRWATRGGGALQLPKQIRSAVVADPGYRLVVADASQLEPRILAAMSRDELMAKASRGQDLYQALVDEGIVDTRAHAKVAMLGALYGATSGEAGQLMPRLLRAFPKATGHVEDAARAGERGEVVTTWLGRSSPPAPERWHEIQRRASQLEATPADQRQARSQARDWGRFTRNFVVQGTAAEWALCWMAELRLRLGRMGSPGHRPELVYFLHDEVMVHTPAAVAVEVEEAIEAAARQAGELLFGSFPVDFALEIACVENYAQAK
ncbi:MAG: bifunctional 3'-5' exonuclease/DNA polymerase, partial [Propionibacteriaceae bacterium]